MPVVPETSSSWHQRLRKPGFENGTPTCQGLVLWLCLWRRIFLDFGSLCRWFKACWRFRTLGLNLSGNPGSNTTLWWQHLMHMTDPICLTSGAITLRNALLLAGYPVSVGPSIPHTYTAALNLQLKNLRLWKIGTLWLDKASGASPCQRHRTSHPRGTLKNKETSDFKSLDTLTKVSSVHKYIYIYIYAFIVHIIEIGRIIVISINLFNILKYDFRLLQPSNRTWFTPTVRTVIHPVAMALAPEHWGNDGPFSMFEPNCKPVVTKHDTVHFRSTGKVG